MCVTSGPDGSAGGDGGPSNCLTSSVRVVMATALRVTQPIPCSARPGSIESDCVLFYIWGKCQVSDNFSKSDRRFLCRSRTMTHFPLRSLIVLDGGAAMVGCYY